MQRFMGYPLTLKKIDFDVSLDINGRLRHKSKDVMYMIITLPEAKKLTDFIMSSILLSKTDICSKLFFRS